MVTFLLTTSLTWTDQFSANFWPDFRGCHLVKSYLQVIRSGIQGNLENRTKRSMGIRCMLKRLEINNVPEPKVEMKMIFKITWEEHGANPKNRTLKLEKHFEIKPLKNIVLKKENWTISIENNSPKTNIFHFFILKVHSRHRTGKSCTVQRTTSR